MGQKPNGKLALVTGGAAGIGAACCRLFAKQGVRVVSGDITPPAQPIEGVEYLKLDVTSVESCAQCVHDINKRFGNIDILVNNAGIIRDALTERMTDVDWDAVMAVNLKGVFNITRLVGPQMRAAGSGSIVNISSVVGEDGNIGQANYAAAKAGVIGLTKTWAKEFTRKGVNVRVNAVTPGYIMTDILKTVPQPLLDGFAQKAALGRLGQPEEVARAVLFLAGDDASYITGHVLSVSGGLRL